MNIIVKVPKNTMAYKCGERFVLCDAENTNGKITIKDFLDFAKTKEELKGIDYTSKLIIKAV